MDKYVINKCGTIDVNFFIYDYNHLDLCVTIIHNSHKNSYDLSFMCKTIYNKVMQQLL
jgi:hypothetical protein